MVGCSLAGRTCRLLSRPRFANLESRHPASHPLTYSCILKLLGPSHVPPTNLLLFPGSPGIPEQVGHMACSILLSPVPGEAQVFSPLQEGLDCGLGGGCPASGHPVHPLGGCHEDTLACHRHPTPRACSAKVGFHSLPMSNGRRQDTVPSPLGF